MIFMRISPPSRVELDLKPGSSLIRGFFCAYTPFILQYILHGLAKNAAKTFWERVERDAFTLLLANPRKLGKLRFFFI
jgi:hypothetical protein